MSISAAESIELFQKQTALVARLGAVANAQRRILSFMNANYEAFDDDDESETEDNNNSSNTTTPAAPSCVSAATAAVVADLATADATIVAHRSFSSSASEGKAAEAAAAPLWGSDAAAVAAASEAPTITSGPQPLAAALVPPSDVAASSSAPSSAVTATLEHVYGYGGGLRGRRGLASLALIDEDTMLYAAAGVGIVESISNSRQRIFKGHASSVPSAAAVANGGRGIGGAALTCLAYSPARRLAATGQIGPSSSSSAASLSSVVYVWSVDDPHAAEPFLTVTVPNVDAITAAAFSPDGSRLLIVGGALRSSEPSEDGVVGFASQTIHIVSVGPAVAGGGRVVASLVVPSPSSSSAAAIVSPLAGRIMAAAWIVDARVEQNSSLVTVGNGTIQFWFLSPSPGGEDGSNAHSTMTLVPAKPLLGGFAGANKCSSSSAIIAGGCFPSVVSTADATYVGNSCDGSLLVFDGRRLVRKIAAHAGASVDAIAARPATAEIVTGGSDGFVRVWDERTLRVVATFDLNTSDKARSANGVRSIAVSARDDGGSHSFSRLLSGRPLGQFTSLLRRQTAPALAVLSSPLLCLGTAASPPLSRPLAALRRIRRSRRPLPLAPTERFGCGTSPAAVRRTARTLSEPAPSALWRSVPTAHVSRSVTATALFRSTTLGTFLRSPIWRHWGR